jgi:uncharacterized damage-inducible protein DinB
MSIAETILPELDHEMQVTRTLLERVPESDPEWKPHPKSMALGRLATHIAELLGWVDITFQQTELDFSKGGYKPTSFTTTADLLAMFDAKLKSARAVLAATPDEAMMVPWTLRNGEHVIFTQPRIGVLRAFVLSHMIHHRGQLSVYLRLNDVPLPSIYGPTADSPM